MFNFKKYNNIALIVAAGTGSRFSSEIHKQYTKIANLPILTWTIKHFIEHDEIDAVKVVIHKDDINLYNYATDGLNILPFVIGGNERQESVAIGIESLKDLKPKNVLIHDACRPLISKDIISNIISGLNKNDCVIPVMPITNTIKKINNNNFLTISREDLYYAQTPQGVNYKAYKSLLKNNDLPKITDDASLFEYYNKSILKVDGNFENIKITTMNDALIAERFLKNMNEVRTGLGFDAHRFAENSNDLKNYVVLGGIKIESDRAIEAHSDGDVLIHAIVDSILGAISEGDIGEHFPPTDNKWKNVSSKQFLKYAGDLVIKKGGTILNIDSTIICQVPQISPYKELMCAEIASTLGIDRKRVNVKATTTEKMGFTGRKEGIAAQSIATINIIK